MGPCSLAMGLGVTDKLKISIIQHSNFQKIICRIH